MGPASHKQAQQTTVGANSNALYINCPTSKLLLLAYYIVLLIIMLPIKP
jgi:hypothetical protein